MFGHLESLSESVFYIKMQKDDEIVTYSNASDIVYQNAHLVNFLSELSTIANHMAHVGLSQQRLFTRKKFKHLPKIGYSEYSSRNKYSFLYGKSLDFKNYFCENEYF